MRKRSSALSRTADLLLSTDERIRPRARLTLWAASVFMTWLAGLAIMHGMGLASGSSLAVVATYDLVGLTIFYTLIRSGWSARFQDQAMVEYQVMFAIGGATIGYFFFPSLRAALMQAICMAQVFGFFTLRPVQAMRTGLFSMITLGGTLLLAPALGVKDFDPGFDSRFEALRLAMSLFIIMLLSLMSRRYAQIRAKVRADKGRLAEAVAQVNELVTHDPLTGLHNRQYMQDMLDRERARLARGGASYCVALIDLDHFKQVNDSHGHQVGDEVLVSFAQTARQMLRTTDLLARWGGEEFLLLMPDTDPSGHGWICTDRLRTRLVEVMASSSAPGLRITFSAGVAASSRDEPPEQVLERADKALYEAKAAGRNRCVVAGAQLAD